jgi:hypothetical protein
VANGQSFIVAVAKIYLSSDMAFFYFNFSGSIVDLHCKSSYLSWLFAVAQGLEFLENDD